VTSKTVVSRAKPLRHRHFIQDLKPSWGFQIPWYNEYQPRVSLLLHDLVHFKYHPSGCHNRYTRACNTLAFRAVARSATHRHWARRPAPWPRACAWARTATLPWWGGRRAGKGVPPPPPQRRRPAGVARCPRAGPSLRRAAHLHTAGEVADKAHGRAGGIDRRATGRP